MAKRDQKTCRGEDPRTGQEYTSRTENPPKVHSEAPLPHPATDVLSLRVECLECWHPDLSLATVRLSFSFPCMNGDNRGKSWPQPIKVRLSREKHNFDRHALNDLCEVASRIVRRQ